MSSRKELPSLPSDTHTSILRNAFRLKALDDTGLLDSPGEEAFDRIVRLATMALHKPVGLLSLVDGHRQFFKSHSGLPAAIADTRETPLTHSFCQYVTSEDMPLAVNDAREHSLLRDNLAVSDLGVIAYLGVPVHAPDGQTLGSLCAIGAEPHEWTEAEQTVLSDLAVIIETEIALREEATKRQLLMRELDHRVKNLFTVVSGMITMTARGSESPDAMAKVLRGRVHALAKAHELIRPAITQESAEATEVSLQTLVASVVEPYLSRETERLAIDGSALMLGSTTVTHLALVLHELATNAAKYGCLSVPHGQLSVKWEIDDTVMTLVWAESGGPGIESPPNRVGFGSRLIDATVSGRLQGKIDNAWHSGGVVHTLSIPVALLGM